MAEKFIEWLLEDCIPDIYANIYNAVIKAVKLLCIAILSPIWILPFTYWYFFVRDNEKEEYPNLKESVNEEVFERMIRDFPEMLEDWNNECQRYYEMTDEEVGEGGENLTRFQVAVFGASETIEAYLDQEIEQIRKEKVGGCK